MLSVADCLVADEYLPEILFFGQELSQIQT